jgi:hypothetical protein
VQTVDRKTHSICARCAKVFSAMGSVFSGVTAAVTECCFCGHEHRDGLWMTLGVGPCACDGTGCERCNWQGSIDLYPWWCGEKLGVHRVPSIEIVR